MKRRFPVNISPNERAARVVLGSGGAIAGILLLIGAAGWLAAFLDVLLVAASLDLLVTGATGYSPLYQLLAHVPRSPRSRSA